MKILFNKYTALFAFLGVLLLAGCDNALTPVSTNSGGAITITVSNTAIGSRTLFPSADFTKYELGFSGPGGLTHTETLLGGQSSITVSSLASGSWTIDVTGYVTIDGTEYAAAQGSETVTIDSTSQNINIPISATMGGDDGFFSYSVIFPQNMFHAGLWFYEFDTNNNYHYIDLIEQPAGLIEDLPPGYYLMFINIYNGYETAHMAEIVHIYSNMETRADYVFTHADFSETITISGKVNFTINGAPSVINVTVYAYTESGEEYNSYEFIGSDSIWSIKVAPYITAETFNFWVHYYDGFDFYTVDTGVSISVLDTNIPNINLGTISLTLDFPPSSHTALIPDQWENGEISNAGDVDWYSLTVVSGTDYYFWRNDSSEDGDGSKTLNTWGGAWYADGEQWFGHGYSNPNVYQADRSGIVYVRVKAGSPGNTGTYGIVYNTTGIKPSSFIIPTDHTLLTNNQWEEDEILHPGIVDWYSITVTNETDYYIWWNDGWDGDGSKNLRARVSAWYSDGTEIFFGERGNGFRNPHSFQAVSSGVVYVMVGRFSIAYAGSTYGIVYNTTGTKPPASWDPPASSTPLAIYTWENGEITSPGDEEWYSFTATNGTYYYIWWNDDWIGDGSKTLETRVDAWYSDGINIFVNSISLTSRPSRFQADRNDTVYVRVRARGHGYDTGTYGIVYSTYNTMPAYP